MRRRRRLLLQAVYRPPRGMFFFSIVENYYSTWGEFSRNPSFWTFKKWVSLLCPFIAVCDYYRTVINENLIMLKDTARESKQ